MSYQFIRVTSYVLLFFGCVCLPFALPVIFAYTLPECPVSNSSNVIQHQNDKTEASGNVDNVNNVYRVGLLKCVPMKKKYLEIMLIIFATTGTSCLLIALLLHIILKKCYVNSEIDIVTILPNDSESTNSTNYNDYYNYSQNTSYQSIYPSNQISTIYPSNQTYSNFSAPSSSNFSEPTSSAQSAQPTQPFSVYPSYYSHNQVL